MTSISICILSFVFISAGNIRDLSPSMQDAHRGAGELPRCRTHLSAKSLAVLYNDDLGIGKNNNDLHEVAS